MQYVIDNSDATLVIVDAEQAPLVAEIRDQLPKVREVVVFGGEVPGGLLGAGTRSWRRRRTTSPRASPATTAGAAMIYTSGTTGKPKGALRTTTDREHRLRAARRAAPGAPATRCTSRPGRCTTRARSRSRSSATRSGAPIVVLRKFDAVRVARGSCASTRVTNTFSAPTQLKRIVSLPADELAQADLSSMRCLIANAAPVPYALKQEIIEKLGDGFLFEVYGSTELGVTTVLEPEDQLRKPGSCGKPYGGIEIKIVQRRRHRGRRRRAG